MSEECVFKCLCCELVNSKVKMGNFSARPVSLVQKLRAQGYKGFIYVYNIMVCGGWRHRGCRSSIRSRTSVCWATLRFLRTLSRSLLTSPLSGSDTSREMTRTETIVWRWLLVALRYPWFYRIWVLSFHGPWVIRKLIGNVPTIIGHKLPQFTYRGDGYCEQMIDATADKLIASVGSFVSSYE